MPKRPPVVFLNPRTCGIYKDGGTRFKTDPKTGRRTADIDNELLDHVTAYLENKLPPGSTRVGLKPWDLVTPNRASSNIGEFAILLPGEEQVVLTKEVFVFRILDETLLDAFYLLWALSLKAVRDQWRRIVLMQTNREDCGSRYR